MDMLIRNLRILWRTERLLAEIRLRLLMRRIGMLALAAVVGLFAVAMLNVAGYVYLVPMFDPTGAALVVAAVDALLAALLILAAQPQKPGTETRVLEEMRDFALADLEAQGEALQGDLHQLREDVKGMRQAVSSFAHNPLDALNPQILAQTVSLLTNLLRNKKD